MRKLLIMLACGAVLLLGLAAAIAPAEARRGGGVRMGGHGGAGHINAGRAFRGNVSPNRVVNRNVSRRVDRNVVVKRNVNRKYVYRNGRRGYWRNGAWILAPAVAGATYVASCSYEYNRWQATGSSYWRDRYYNCSN